MKVSVIQGVILSLASQALAFSGLNIDQAIDEWANEHLGKRALTPQQQDGGAPLPAANPPFDPVAQRVATTGDHAYAKPGPLDSRGECPGLNALANHAYIPRNGFATIAQFIDGTYAGFGMERDLGGFLAIFGAIIDGNGQGWYIGGLPHTGILGSHHNYECDSSPLKSDLNQYGSNTMTIDSQWYNLYNRQPDAATANYNLAVMRDFRGSRFNESIAKNPWFFYGPFDGIQVSQAAFTFIYRFMSNKSAENPEGILSKSTLKSFMAYRGPENNLKHYPGEERFPDVFYKRNPSDSYSIPYFQTDILFFASKYPQIISVGCNQGTVNSYTVTSPETISNGAYTASSVAANPLCFSAAVLEAGAVSFAGLNQSQVQQIQNLFNPFLSKAGCPTITQPNFSFIKNCPGFTTYGGPTGPVAPGAIQS